MKPRPTDAEFDELKRKRDASIAASIDKLCVEKGWDRTKIGFHVSNAGHCYCACPEGPCQHIWDGPEETGDNYSSATCSRCGCSAISHDMRCGP
jgi:hypothetical protein